MNTKTLVLFVLLSIPALSQGGCYDETKAADINYNSCRLAAEQNDATAQYYLGQMYRNGEGVEKDLQQSVRWYHKAAQQGNAFAQYNLGWMYDLGEGVPKDQTEALNWYSKAAEQGDKYAPFNLGVMYFTGKSPDDFAKTYFWFDVALSNGNDKGQKWRDKIAKKMSPEQIEEARVLLKTWQGRRDGAIKGEQP